MRAQVCTLRTYKDPAHTNFEGSPIGEVVGTGTAVPGGITKRGNTAQVKFLQLNGLPIKLHNMKVRCHALPSQQQERERGRHSGLLLMHA